MLVFATIVTCKQGKNCFLGRTDHSRTCMSWQVAHALLKKRHDLLSLSFVLVHLDIENSFQHPQQVGRLAALQRVALNETEKVLSSEKRIFDVDCLVTLLFDLLPHHDV